MAAAITQPFRVIEREGEPWFVAADICKALTIGNVSDAYSKLDGDEKNTIAISDGIQGNPNTLIVNEAGMYSLVLSSKKAAAKRFKKWITSEVIPAIRKTGSYSVPAATVQNPVLQALMLPMVELDRVEQSAGHLYRGFVGR